MKDYHINIFFSDEDDGYVADIPDLAMCSAFGNTPAEALAEVETADNCGWKQPALKASRSQNQLIVRLSIVWLHNGIPVRLMKSWNRGSSLNSFRRGSKRSEVGVNDLSP